MDAKHDGGKVKAIKFGLPKAPTPRWQPSTSHLLNLGTAAHHGVGVHATIVVVAKSHRGSATSPPGKAPATTAAKSRRTKS